MKLYELAEEYRADVAKLQDLDLPPEVVLDTIDSMQGDIKDKIKAVIFVASEMKATGLARLDAAKRMMESGQSELNRAEGLFSYAQIAIQNSGLTLPIKYDEFNVNLQKNPPSCDITDMEKLPEKFKRTEVKTVIESSLNEPEFLLQLHKLADASNVKIISTTIEFKVDKKAVLTELKALHEENNQREVGTPAKTLPGASINPTSFRLTVK
jgi:hypothetical protein